MFLDDLPLLSHGCVLECALRVGIAVLLDILLQCVSARDQQIIALEVRASLEWCSANATQQGNCDEVKQLHDGKAGALGQMERLYEVQCFLVLLVRGSVSPL